MQEPGWVPTDTAGTEGSSGRDGPSALGLGRFKSSGDPLFGVPPWKHQLGIFLCCCAMSKWLCGMGRLSLCHGKPGMDPVGKPGLTVSVGCARRRTGTPRSLEPLLWTGISPAVEVAGAGDVTERVLWDWEVSSTASSIPFILLSTYSWQKSFCSCLVLYCTILLI